MQHNSWPYLNTNIQKIIVPSIPQKLATVYYTLKQTDSIRNVSKKERFKIHFALDYMISKALFGIFSTITLKSLQFEWQKQVGFDNMHAEQPDAQGSFLKLKFLSWNVQRLSPIQLHDGSRNTSLVEYKYQCPASHFKDIRIKTIQVNINEYIKIFANVSLLHPNIIRAI